MKHKPNQNGYVIRQEKKSVITDKNGENISSVVYTNKKFAKRIVDYLSPQFTKTDTFLDPCKGDGAFYNNLPKPKDWCEIQQGKDFFAYDKKASWIITNPPWQGKVYAPFANHCFEVADNVVFLVKLFGAIGTTRRLRDALTNKHGMKEIIICDWKQAGFYYVDGSAKAGEGFVLAIVHWQKNYTKNCQWTYWTDDVLPKTKK
jgi:hypothetical protein